MQKTKSLIKKAFTLAELLVALAVIGVLVAILMPIVFNIIPDQNALMAKRAYYTTQTIVSELINDDTCYPDQTHATDPRIGFDDGYGYVNCEKWGESSDTSSYITTEGDTLAKFGVLFADKVDLKKGTYSTASSGVVTFTTKDTMTWSFDGTKKFIADDETSYVILKVDVNGSMRPNCGQSDAIKCSDNITSGYDQFLIKIYADGSIDILDPWASEAINMNNNLNGSTRSSGQWDSDLILDELAKHLEECPDTNKTEYYCDRILTHHGIGVQGEDYDKCLEDPTQYGYHD